MATARPGRGTASVRHRMCCPSPPRSLRSRRNLHGSSRNRAHEARRDAKANPYTMDLDKNPANYQSLSPLTFLERAAFDVSQDISPILHGEQRITYAEFYARTRRLASALAQARDRARRYGRGDRAEHSADARCALRRDDDGRRLERDQLPAERARNRLHSRSRRGEGFDRRQGIRRAGARGAEAVQGQALRHRHRRCGVRRRRVDRRDGIRGVS